MKTIITVLFLGLAMCVWNNNISAHNGTKKIKKTYAVSGSITKTSDFCGGMIPPPDMLKQLKTPMPFAGKKLYIKATKQNSINIDTLMSFTANKEGLFSFRLTPGSYCIIQESQLKELNLAEFEKNSTYVKYTSKECLENWWSTCFLSITVSNKNITKLHINFHEACYTDGTNPCLHYQGPTHP
jgi:hypothetical protein